MTLIKFKNESPARTLFPNSVDLFNEFFSDYAGSDFRKWNAPAVNISENETMYKLNLAVPGLKKEDFKIALEENTLVVSAERKQESNEKTERYTRKEFSFSSFTRRFSLPENVDQAGIVANYEDGIMELQLPKKAEEKPKAREISIK
ncbi:MAG: Hsp20/alpha crystallin family protein [Bacteroidetes bacterium]|jgi:HSP20 family protein|nr:Hsp20/alpha crystallin family protein [Bacteroidota bacterium]